MGGIFGTVLQNDRVGELFYGIDYNFHLGTKRDGMAVWDSGQLERSTLSIENDYFPSKFDPNLVKFRAHLASASSATTTPTLRLSAVICVPLPTEITIGLETILSNPKPRR